MTYFERPLCDLVDCYGFDKTIAAQRAVDGARDLLDEMLAACGMTERPQRFLGHMGMFTLNHVLVHLRNLSLREQGGLQQEYCHVSEEALFLNRIPAEYRAFYTIVPQSKIRELLGTRDNRYCAVLSNLKAWVNSALVSQQVLAFLMGSYRDRFQFFDHTPVTRILLDSVSAEINAGGHRVSAGRVILCTNGFTSHVVQSTDGETIRPNQHQRVHGTIGYMAGYYESTLMETQATSYILNEVIGEKLPYIYMTRRAAIGPKGPTSLTCVGGPEAELADRGNYSRDATIPDGIVAQFDNDIRPLVFPDRDAQLGYDYTWHGLMAYTDSKLRLIGVEPRNPVLLYNLGCNGVGILPSVYGGQRIAHLVAGHQLEPSIFDPA